MRRLECVVFEEARIGLEHQQIGIAFLLHFLRREGTAAKRQLADVSHHKVRVVELEPLRCPRAAADRTRAFLRVLRPFFPCRSHPITPSSADDPTVPNPDRVG